MAGAPATLAAALRLLMGSPCRPHGAGAPETQVPPPMHLLVLLLLLPEDSPCRPRVAGAPATLAAALRLLMGLPCRPREAGAPETQVPPPMRLLLLLLLLPEDSPYRPRGAGARGRVAQPRPVETLLSRRVQSV